jgi:ribonuclease R
MENGRAAEASGPARKPARARTGAAVPAAGGSAGKADLAGWETLGIVCSVNERRADDATRDVEAWLKCQYMKERVGEQYRGRITGVAPFGIFVTLETLYVEGMVHVSDLGSEYFQFNETSHELRGERTGQRYRLTDEIDVQVSRVNLEGRRIDFRLVTDAAARVRPGGDAGAGTEDGSAGGGRRPDGPPGRKAARGKTPAVREAQAARKATARGPGSGHGRGFKKAGSGQAARQRKKR